MNLDIEWWKQWMSKFIYVKKHLDLFRSHLLICTLHCRKPHMSVQQKTLIYILYINIWTMLFQEISHLGEVNHLSQVKIETSTGEKLDRIFILFPNVLLMLSMSPRLSGYQYEVRYNMFHLFLTIFLNS